MSHRPENLARSATDPRMEPAQRAVADAYAQMASIVQRLARSARVIDSEQLLNAHEDLLRAADRMQRNARIVVDLIKADRR